MKRNAFFGLLLLALLLAGGYLTLHPSPAQDRPFEISFWYWQHWYSRTTVEDQSLRSLGVKQLFVLGGSFHWTGYQLNLFQEQEWNDPMVGPKVQLVFNIVGLARDYARIGNDELAKTIISGIRRGLGSAAKGKQDVRGVQIDFDCPTARLDKYAKLLHQIRAGLPKKLAFSITALPTWFTGDAALTVAREVDFVVPQYYENQIPESLDKMRPIANLKILENGLRRMGELGIPFYAGIPSYGRAYVFNENGRLEGVTGDFSAEYLLQNGQLRFVKRYGGGASAKPAPAADYIGEDFYVFETRSSPKQTVVYDYPTPTLAAMNLKIVKDKRPPNCMGVIFFRYPESTELSTISLQSLEAAINGEHPAPELEIKRESLKASPWAAIDGTQRLDRLPVEFSFQVKNVGTASTSVGKDAVEVILTFDRPGIDEAERGDFDEVQTFFGNLDTPCSPERANIIRYRKYYMEPADWGHVATVSIAPNGATECRVTWSALGPGGYERVKSKEPTVIDLERK